MALKWSVTMYCYSGKIHLFSFSYANIPAGMTTNYLPRQTLFMVHPRNQMDVKECVVDQPLCYFFLHRFNDKVKHIKILTKDGCFYIAESRLFKSVLVKVLLCSFFFFLASQNSVALIAKTV